MKFVHSHYQFFQVSHFLLIYYKDSRDCRLLNYSEFFLGPQRCPVNSMIVTTFTRAWSKITMLAIFQIKADHSS